MHGWRKLSFAAAIVLGCFGFIYWKTVAVDATVTVPDIPSNIRDVLIFIYVTFAGGNVAEHYAKIRGAKP